MSWLRILASRVRGLFRKHPLERELNEELRSHIEMLVEENVRKSMSPVAARHAAMRAFGGVEQVKEVYRGRRGLPFVDSLGQDVRYSFRMMRQNLGFTAVAVLSLALGIGANTAIFSLVDAVMLKYLPVERPQELLHVAIGGFGSFTNPIWEQLRDHQDVFSGLFAWGNWRFNLSAGGEAHYAQGILVSGDYFRTLGVHPILGRLLTPADDRRGCDPVAVVSYGFWRSHYSGDGGIVGKKILLEGHPFEIVGVTAPGFYGVEVGQKFDVAAPICVEAIVNNVHSMLDQRSAWWLQAIGRPKPGVSAQQASARLKTLAPQVFQATVPPAWSPDMQQDYRRKSFETKPAANGLGYVRRQYRAALIALMVVVGVVLLIACANIANLLLARAALRQREIAVRLAIGATRARLIRQLLTESILLSSIGAAFGVLFADWGSALLVRYLATHNQPVFLDVALNLRILGFTAAVAIATGILFGVAPAWRATRVPLNAAMKESSRGLTAGRARLGLGKALVVFQVALSLVLLVAAGLLATTFRILATQDLGFDRGNVLIASVDLRNAGYSKDRLTAVYERILGNLQAIPGVRSASCSSLTPISGSIWNENIRVDGYASQGSDDALVYLNRVSPAFFETLGTPLRAGRDFNARDSIHSPLVAVVNETLAKKFFHGASPVGKGFRTEGSDAKPGPFTEIIGVVKDAKYGEMREQILPTAYLSMSQEAEPQVQNSYELRTAGAAYGVVGPVKAAFEAVNKNIDLEFTTLATQVDESINRERLLATLSGFFGALALLLAAIGLYGVMSYTVARRRNEIGIRMALGAEQTAILWMVLREVLLLVGAGMTVGLAAAAASTRLLASMLYGLNPRDPATLAVSGIVLLLVGALAGYLPARRAARLDPMTTLREE